MPVIDDDVQYGIGATLHVKVDSGHLRIHRGLWGGGARRMLI